MSHQHERERQPLSRPSATAVRAGAAFAIGVTIASLLGFQLGVAHAAPPDQQVPAFEQAGELASAGTERTISLRRLP